MTSTAFARSAAARSLPLVVASSWGIHQNYNVACEEKPKFQKATCKSNVVHTHDTRLVTLQVPSNWNDKGAVANVVVRAEIEGVSPDSGCCACCKCAPGPCSCPKTPTGCCACCSCTGTCGCAKVVPSATPTESTSSVVARPYNPLSASSGDTLTLLVKRYGESAQMGSKLHSLKEGDSIELKGPNKQWTLPEPGKVKEYAMIAGGTGVTPIVQTTQAILETDKEAKVSLYTFNKTLEDVLLTKELYKLMVQYPGRFNFRIFVESVGERAFMKTFPFRVEATPTLEVLQDLLPKPTDKDGQVMVCVCGRPGMTAAVAGPKTKDYKQGEVGGVLKELGFSKQQVRKF